MSTRYRVCVFPVRSDDENGSARRVGARPNLRAVSVFVFYLLSNEPRATFKSFRDIQKKTNKTKLPSDTHVRHSTARALHSPIRTGRIHNVRIRGKHICNAIGLAIERCIHIPMIRPRPSIPETLTDDRKRENSSCTYYYI